MYIRTKFKALFVALAFLFCFSACRFVSGYFEVDNTDDTSVETDLFENTFLESAVSIPGEPLPAHWLTSYERLADLSATSQILIKEIGKPPESRAL